MTIWLSFKAWNWLIQYCLYCLHILWWSVLTSVSISVNKPKQSYFWNRFPYHMKKVDFASMRKTASLTIEFSVMLSSIISKILNNSVIFSMRKTIFLLNTTNKMATSCILGVKLTQEFPYFLWMHLYPVKEVNIAANDIFSHRYKLWYSVAIDGLCRKKNANIYALVHTDTHRKNIFEISGETSSNHDCTRLLYSE